MGTNHRYIRVVETSLDSNSVANGNYEFGVEAGAGRHNIIDYFYFVDGDGDKTAATAGTVSITFSAGAEIFNTIEHGDFNAADAEDSTRQKPNAYGRVEKVRVALSGVTGVSGFRGLLSQGAS